MCTTLAKALPSVAKRFLRNCSKVGGSKKSAWLMKPYLSFNHKLLSNQIDDVSFSWNIISLIFSFGSCWMGIIVSSYFDVVYFKCIQIHLNFLVRMTLMSIKLIYWHEKCLKSDKCNVPNLLPLYTEYIVIQYNQLLHTRKFDPNRRVSAKMHAPFVFR